MRRNTDFRKNAGNQRTPRVFLAVLVGLALSTAAIAGAATIPSPRDHLGFKVGDDFKLANWTEINRYFDKLAAASDRIKVLDLGKTTLGRRMIMAVISSPANLAGLDEYREIQKRLHDPRGLGAEEKENLIKQGKAVVYVSCSIHSTEIAASQMSMELAYRLASEETAETARILEETILLLVPSVNPDGIDLVTDWYLKHLGTPYEASPMPWLYHHYTGHDNNRDWFMLTQKETQALSKVLYQEWFPLLVYDIHQMGSTGPRLFIPPYQDPINPNLDPLLLRELYVLVGEAAVNLTREGKTGVATNTIFDAWYNMANRAAPLRHNALGILSEAASANLASPIFLRRSDIRVSGGTNEIQAANLEPWPGGWWRLRDIVEYEEIVAYSFLQTIAKNKEKYLRNYALFAERQVLKGEKEPPFAYVIPPEQKDGPAALRLVQVIRRNGAEVHQAQREFVADEARYPAQSYIILLAQPYRAFVKDLLERKSYPIPPGRDAVEHLPYDEASWTLPLQMGVKVVQVTNPFQTEMKLLGEVQAKDSEIIGSGSRRYFLKNEANNESTLINRLMKKGIRSGYTEKPFQAAGDYFPPGTIVIEGRSADRSLIKTLGKGLAVDIFASDAEPAGRIIPLKQPKIGVYQPWSANMDEGWLRWTLEQYEFPFRVIHNEEIRAGNLNRNLTHILLPSMPSSGIVDGRRPGEVPPQYEGGIGKEGISALNTFVQSGGILVAIENASDFAIEYLGLPVRNIIEPRRRGGESDAAARPGEGRERVYCPGSLLEVKVNDSIRGGFGIGTTGTVFSYFSPVFTTEKATVIASYPAYNPLLSGILINGEKILGKAAAVECEVGKGKVLLLGFDPIHRAQAHGTFKFVFNALVY